MVREIPHPDVVMTEEELPDKDSVPSQKDRIEEEDWDVLIVLDAMRWDVMDALTDREVEALRTPSKGSTPGWVDSVWCQRGWEDVAYLSANNMVEQTHTLEKYDGNIKDYVDYIDLSYYDRGKGVVNVTKPETMVQKAAEQEPPMVVHMIQPHTPFIGRLGLRTMNRELPIVDDIPEDTVPDGSVAKLAYEGKIDLDVFRQAYICNAHMAFEWAERLAKRMDNSVITSDHGEGLGPDHWDHGGARSNCNRVVPWLEV